MEVGVGEGEGLATAGGLALAVGLLADFVAVTSAVVVGALGRSVGFRAAQRLAASVSSAIVCRAPSRLATSIEVRTLSW